MFDTLIKLLTKLVSFFESTIPSARLSNDSSGRKWFLESIGYEEKLTLEKMREITNRKDLNDLFVERFDETSVKAKKGISAIKTEISALYSFQKCFVQRFKGRLHFYRDDLSQKGARTMHSTGRAYGLFNELKKNLDS
jgi:hypothetical protein